MFHQPPPEKPASRIKAFLQKHAKSVRCDQCISDGLGMRGRRAVWKHTKELEKDPAFKRTKGHCPICGENRLLTGIA